VDYTEPDRSCTDPGRHCAEERYTRHQKTKGTAHTETIETGKQENQRSSIPVQAAEGKNQQQIRKNTWFYRGSTPTEEEGRINTKKRCRSHQAKKSRSRTNLHQNCECTVTYKKLVDQGEGSGYQPRGQEDRREGRGEQLPTATSKKKRANEERRASIENQCRSHQTEKRRSRTNLQQNCECTVTYKKIVNQGEGSRYQPRGQEDRREGKGEHLPTATSKKRRANEEGRASTENQCRSHQTEKRRSRTNLQQNCECTVTYKKPAAQGERSSSQPRRHKARSVTPSSPTAISKNRRVSEERRASAENRRRPLQAEGRSRRKNQQLIRKLVEEHKDSVAQGVRSSSQLQGLEARRGVPSSLTATLKRRRASEGGDNTKSEKEETSNTAANKSKKTRSLQPKEKRASLNPERRLSEEHPGALSQLRRGKEQTP